MAMKRWNAGLYTRLSREDGDKLQSDSIVNQRALLLDYLKTEPAIAYVDSYTDDGYTGANFDRPEFQRLLRDVRSGRIDCIVVKDLSRFGRNYLATGYYLEELFPQLNVRFIALGDHLDSHLRPEELSGLTLPIKNLLNEEYCKDISKKVRSVLDAKRRRGEFIGNFAPYGYEKDPADRHRLQCDPQTGQTVQQIFRWYLQGRSLRAIARQLNCDGVLSPAAYRQQHAQRCGLEPAGPQPLWGVSTIRRILTSQVYLGHLVQGQRTTKSHKLRTPVAVDPAEWIVVEHTHPPLICQQEFDQVQALLSRHSRSAPGRGGAYPLAGLIYCAECGRAMNRKVSGGRAYYVCATHKLSPQACASHTIREDALFAAIVTALADQIAALPRREDSYAPPVWVQEQKAALAGAILKLRQQVCQLQERRLGLYEDLKQGLLTQQDYHALRERYAQALDSARQELDRLELQQRQAVAPQPADPGLAAFCQGLPQAGLPRAAALQLIQGVWVHSGQEATLLLRAKPVCLCSGDLGHE